MLRAPYMLLLDPAGVAVAAVADTPMVSDLPPSPDGCIRDVYEVRSLVAWFYTQGDELAGDPVRPADAPDETPEYLPYLDQLPDAPWLAAVEMLGACTAPACASFVLADGRTLVLGVSAVVP